MTDWTNRYDSHLPMLWALAADPLRKLRVVVEYGPGQGSTPGLLNLARFPDLTTLVSYEDDVVWRERLIDEIPADPRWTMHLVTRGQMGYEAPLVADTDLALVDAATADSRVALVLALRGKVPYLVLHDYDALPIYADAAGLWPYAYVPVECPTPMTALLTPDRLPAHLVKMIAEAYRW